MKRDIKSYGPFHALLLASLLATNATAINYTDVTWSGAIPATDPEGNPLGYALWTEPANWSGGNVPSLADPGTGNPNKLHFNQQPASVVPCVISNYAAEVGAIAMGDWGSGHGSGILILTNGASLKAGFPGGEWTGVGFPEGNCTLYIGTNCTASFGSHLWVGNGTNSDGTSNSGTVIVDGGTLNILNGQLGVGWIGTGGTNYMVVSNNAKVNLGQWAASTIGMPGNNSRGQLDLSTGGTITINGNATTYFPGLVASGQLTAYAGAGTVSWSYDPVANTTTLLGIPPANVNTPVISAQPTNVVAGLGGTATFSVQISNVACNYQWMFNNQPLTDADGISGSKTDKLTIAGITTANSGVYTVYATNKAVASEWVLSSAVSLTTEAFSFYPVVTITGIPGNTYRVDYTTSLTPPVSWVSLQTVTLGTTSQFVVDGSSPMSNKRFYRVVLLP